MRRRRGSETKRRSRLTNPTTNTDGAAWSSDHAEPGLHAQRSAVFDLPSSRTVRAAFSRTDLSRLPSRVSKLRRRGSTRIQLSWPKLRFRGNKNFNSAGPKSGSGIDSLKTVIRRIDTVNKDTGNNEGNFSEKTECTVALWEVTHNDVLALEHFADAVLRDDFFFRKGHWLSLVADSRVQLMVVRVQEVGQLEWSEICGVIVLYADSVLHNLFLSRTWRGMGLGSAIIEAVSPSVIRAKTDMVSGDPSGFYARLGFTHEEARKGKRGQIRVLTKLGESTRANNLKRKKKDVQNDPDVPARDL